MLSTFVSLSVNSAKSASGGLIWVLIVGLAGLCLGVMVGGCDGFGPGLGDFEFDLAGGYILSRSSGDHVEVCPKGAYTLNKDPHIPPKVVKVAWNERFIIAKQYDLKRKWPDKPRGHPTNYNVLVPDKTKSNYWIIDASIDKVYGPFNALEFKKQRVALSVPDTLVLRSPYSYKKEIAEESRRRDKEMRESQSK